MRPVPHLPDEIIKEIVSPALLVPDESFASNSWRSPFSYYKLTSSTILVVCKDWLRVSTPLLYETVILRSKAQAVALAATLKQNAQLGIFIKKMRLEGGYGASTFEIMKRSPNLTDLWITISLWSTDSVSGYRKGFRLISPRRLIICETEQSSKKSAIRVQLSNGLAEAIGKEWTILTRTSLWVRFGVEALEPVYKSLVAASRLEYLEFMDQLHYPDSFHDLMSIPSLKTIRVQADRRKPLFDKLSSGIQDAIIVYSLDVAMVGKRDIYDKVHFVRRGGHSSFRRRTEEPAIVSHPLDPNYRPLANAPLEDRAFIWKTILLMQLVSR
ncbi:hypothetical protein CC2G_007003 [Coprinopsis cinerea AmutBmut pab1-1]|nr:hypothetical protein CC2G_007003 [Coprinopsis cinerea AmutBmut pab1-1]